MHCVLGVQGALLASRNTYNILYYKNNRRNVLRYFFFLNTEIFHPFLSQCINQSDILKIKDKILNNLCLELVHKKNYFYNLNIKILI